MSHLPLHLIPWLPPKHWPQSIMTHPLIYPSLLAFKKASLKGKLASIPGPLTSLRGNPDFPPGSHTNFLQKEWPHEDVLIMHFYQDGKIMPHEKLIEISKTSAFSFWTYRQIRHFLESHANQTHGIKQLTQFETLCHRKIPQRHLISLLYTLLNDPLTPTISPSQSAWNRDLPTPLTNEEWNKVHEYIHKGSLNVTTQENGYKIATRWYRTPSRLHKFKSTIPNTCWRCGVEVGTMLHIWWDCAILQPFWKEVHKLITQITTFTLDYTPAQYLLHHTSLSKRNYFKSLAMHLVNAARLCIPKHWQSTSVPSIGEWCTRISKTKDMEELIHVSQDRTQKFTATWSCWIHFTTTERYRQYLPRASTQT